MNFCWCFHRFVSIITETGYTWCSHAKEVQGNIDSVGQCFPTRVPREIKEEIKNFEIPRKIPNIPRNIAGIFVRQLVILE
jgi:hypothetical protein